MEKVVVAHGGAEAWDRIVRETALQTVDGGFLGPATYPDEDLYALFRTASAMAGQPVNKMYRAFGRFAFPDLVAAFPGSLPAGVTAKQFLMTVDRMMHIEVHKLQPGPHRPYLTYEDPGPDRLVMLYRSSRGLCDLAAGLIDGTADHFGQVIVQAHTECMRDGHPACRFELQFAAEAA